MKATYRSDKPSGTRGPRNAGAAVAFAAIAVLAAILALMPLACVPLDPDQKAERSLRVTASAYNSMRGQTNDDPTVAAWGDTLRPGMRAIAVSRDLIALGLSHGVAVRIEGLDGEYVVRDKMAARWERKIDIYMGDDVSAARDWGTRELTITWIAR